MVAGLESITDGTVSIGDRVVNTVPPKERDIAMVFQNYALYPHMTVYDNMAFGLKLRKLPKEEIDRRVREAAKILGLEEFLERKPKALSGGQRQRVAMGRAIVREPKAFLMDEPLSNLDAKLRVQMRSEIARIQHELSTTTLYVTHDQVEAMTMGDRVAVHPEGHPPAGRRPAVPLRPSEQPVRRGLHRLARHEHGRGHARRVERIASWSSSAVTGSRSPTTCFGSVPELKGYEGKQVIVGIRPEDMEDAELVPDAPAEHRISSAVLLQEALGADVLVHFMIKAPALMTEDAKELAGDVGQEALEAVERGAVAGESEFLARLNPRTKVRKGEPLELVVDVHRMHFFDPENESGYLRRRPRAERLPFVVGAYGWRSDQRRDTTTEGGESRCGSCGCSRCRW